ncbi:MAG: NADH:flavin oxidoreductase [Bacteroidetes bacterium]|nr:NADH:flavin oxidoreductase [Bacteroidota bacterium]
MSSLFTEFILKKLPVKNRIVFPPVVCFHYAGADGIVTTRNTQHYQEIATGGAGIIITEATAVCKDGRLAPFQLGIWSDEHIPGMGQIAATVKGKGAVSLLQIHHAGLITNDQVSEFARGPSVSSNNPRSAALTIEEIEEIRNAFIEAARRAQKAGYQGVELHGAHGYLLNQFASSFFNKREDDYGGTLVNNLRLATDIIHGIRQKCGDDFIIGYRLGANSPTLEDGIAIALHLEQAGVDLLHVSHGGSLLNLPRTPAGFNYNWIIFSGTVIKQHSGIPVIVVNEIKTAERAEWLIGNNLADFVALGRPQLADPDWVNHIKNNEAINQCLGCKPRCRWYEDSKLCPARIKATKDS